MRYRRMEWLAQLKFRLTSWRHLAATSSHPLHLGHRHLGLCVQRQRCTARRCDGLGRRHPDHGIPCGGRYLEAGPPDLKIRFVNVVDLSRLGPETEHPHGLSDRDFDSLFTTDRPVTFNFHSYASLIHKLTYRCKNHDNIHVRGYKEKGSINTPFELAILFQCGARRRSDRKNATAEGLQAAQPIE